MEDGWTGGTFGRGCFGHHGGPGCFGRGCFGPASFFDPNRIRQGSDLFTPREGARARHPGTLLRHGGPDGVRPRVGGLQQSAVPHRIRGPEEEGGRERRRE